MNQDRRDPKHTALLTSGFWAVYQAQPGYVLASGRVVDWPATPGLSGPPDFADQEPEQFVVADPPVEWPRVTATLQDVELGMRERPDRTSPYRHYPWRAYDPMAVKQLHRAFARRVVDGASALSFAREFGFLTMTPRAFLPEGIPVPLDEEGDVAEDVRCGLLKHCRRGEPVDSWLYQARELGGLLALHDVVRHARRYSADDIRATVRALAEQTPAMADYWLWIEADADMGEAQGEPYHEALLRALFDRVDRRLDGLVSPSVGDAPGQISLRPRNLLGAIWAQFAIDLAGQERPPKECPQCRRWWTPTHGAQTYCSNACRQKAYRAGKSGKKLAP
jgi:hypothetical protein